MKDTNSQNNYYKPKIEISKSLKETNKPININTSKRTLINISPTNKNSVNSIVGSKYIKKKENPPTPDSKSKGTQKIFPSIKIDISKYNTEKKPVTNNSVYSYNSKILDSGQKNAPKLKYYERCPNCGFHLNDNVDNA